MMFSVVHTTSPHTKAAQTLGCPVTVVWYLGFKFFNWLEIHLPCSSRTDFIFLSSKLTAGSDCSHEIKRFLLLGRKTVTNRDSVLKSITLPTKVSLVKAMVFPVVMYGCESCTIKKAEHWRINAFELWCQRRLLRVPCCKEIKPVNPKGNQPWIFIGRTDDEAPILWPSVMKSRLTRKDPDAGKYWGQEENRATEDEIVGWHHGLNGHEFEQTPGDSEGQGSLVCLSS